MNFYKSYKILVIELITKMSTTLKDKMLNQRIALTWGTLVKIT